MIHPSSAPRLPNFFEHNLRSDYREGPSPGSRTKHGGAEGTFLALLCGPSRQATGAMTFTHQGTVPVDARRIDQLEGRKAEGLPAALLACERSPDRLFQFMEVTGETERPEQVVKHARHGVRPTHCHRRV